MKVLYFGIYSKGQEYPRNKNLISGLRRNGVEVYEVHQQLAGSFQQRLHITKRFSSAFLFFFKIVLSFFILGWKFFFAPLTDAIIVGHPGYFHIHLARMLRVLFRKKALLVYDVFIPLYDAVVEDRKLFKKKSLIARLLHSFEASCCRSADICLIDTLAHRKYLIQEFNLPSEKVQTVFVGPTIDAGFQSPQILSNSRFRVLFVGTYIPLHGIDVILRAASFLQDVSDIEFCLIGSGQLSKEMKALAEKWQLKNVAFKDWILLPELGKFIRSFDLSLGIFGITEKAGRVIPSKIFDICAAGVPFVTADTPAIREVFAHRENAYLIPAGNSKALVEAILKLKQDPDLRNRISRSAYQIGKTQFSIEQIGKDLKEIFQIYMCQNLRRPFRSD